MSVPHNDSEPVLPISGGGQAGAYAEPVGFAELLSPLADAKREATNIDSGLATARGFFLAGLLGIVLWAAIYAVMRYVFF